MLEIESVKNSKGFPGYFLLKHNIPCQEYHHLNAFLDSCVLQDGLHVFCLNSLYQTVENKSLASQMEVQLGSSVVHWAYTAAGPVTDWVK